MKKRRALDEIGDTRASSQTLESQAMGTSPVHEGGTKLLQKGGVNSGTGGPESLEETFLNWPD